MVREPLADWVGVGHRRIETGPILELAILLAVLPEVFEWSRGGPLGAETVADFLG